jgi:hypothetical protein
MNATATAVDLAPHTRTRKVVHKRLKDFCVWCNLRQQTLLFGHKRIEGLQHERCRRSLHRQHDRPEVDRPEAVNDNIGIPCHEVETTTEAMDGARTHSHTPTF